VFSIGSDDGKVMDALVSVIVPIYKVEPYLNKCVTSLLNQTYENLEIILVDDGSPDACGQMCDDFASDDNRVRVIHQANKGLSEARNSGIDVSTGTYILFVDGDDWIEPDTVECLLKACMDNDADASCSGHYKEFVDRTTTRPLVVEETIYEGDEVVTAAMKGAFAHYAWGKLWKRDLFEGCQFPSGMQFEDVATTWKLFLKCHRVVCVPEILFHYIYRKDSIGNTKTMKNLADRWIAFKERYDVMAGRSEELRKICTKGCLETIGYTWRWLYIVKDKDDEKLQEMRVFLRENREGINRCSLPTRISLFCARHSNPIMVYGCYCLNQIYRRFRGLDRIA